MRHYRRISRRSPQELGEEGSLEDLREEGLGQVSYGEQVYERILQWIGERVEIVMPQKFQDDSRCSQ